MESIHPFESQGVAEDFLLYHRFQYYVNATPQITDPTYDRIEAGVRKQWCVSIADTPGSDNPADYPVYIREGRRPNWIEREERDRVIAERWLANL